MDDLLVKVTKAILLEDCGSTEGWEENLNLGVAVCKAWCSESKAAAFIYTDGKKPGLDFEFASDDELENGFVRIPLFPKMDAVEWAELYRLREEVLGPGGTPWKELAATTRASLADAQAEIARLRGALGRAVNFVQHAQVSSGVCCCGDSLIGHADPMDCGHSPRDTWDYASDRFINEMQALLDTK